MTRMQSRIRNFVAAAALASAPALAQQTLSDGRDAITVDQLKFALLSIQPAVKARLLSDKGALSRFATSLLQEQRIAAAAKRSGFADTEIPRAMMERAVRDALVAAYTEHLQISATGSASPDFKALAKERYLANQKDYVRPEAVRIAHILIPVDVEDENFAEDKQRAKAEDVLKRVRNGEDFGDLAKKNSGDRGSAGQGGELTGWLERGKLVPPFEKAAFALKTGEISGLVRTRYGFHIIRKIDQRKAEQIPFSEVETQLVARIRAEHLASTRGEFLKPFAALKEVEIDDATFEAVKGK